MSFGRIVRGHIRDSDPKRIERALQFYDRQLYVTWNPVKRGGQGIWEVRRKPDRLTQIPLGEWEGVTLIDCRYEELDLIHHVLDCPVLNDAVVDKVRRMDRWGVSDYVGKLDSIEKEHTAKVQADAHQNMIYAARENKRYIREMREALLSGVSPHQILARMK